MLKQYQIIYWIQKIRQSPTRVIISDYTYNCFFSGIPKSKTLIVFPDELDIKGVIAIDKPLDEVEMLDIIKLYKKIK